MAVAVRTGQSFREVVEWWHPRDIDTLIEVAEEIADADQELIERRAAEAQMREQVRQIQGG